jgi:hypothetical protein
LLDSVNPASNGKEGYQVIVLGVRLDHQKSEALSQAVDCCEGNEVVIPQHPPETEKDHALIR